MLAFRLAEWSTDTWIDGNLFENGVPIAYFYANRVSSATEHDSLSPRGNYLFIVDFVVVGKHRRRGVGSRMYEELEKEAKRRGIKKIWLQPQLGSEAFWEKLGFTYRPARTGSFVEMKKTL